MAGPSLVHKSAILPIVRMLDFVYRGLISENVGNYSAYRAKE